MAVVVGFPVVNPCKSKNWHPGYPSEDHWMIYPRLTRTGHKASNIEGLFSGLPHNDGPLLLVSGLSHPVLLIDNP